MSSTAGVFELAGGGRVLFTDRSHGNLSSAVGLDAAGAQSARERLRERLGLERVLATTQVHGVEICTVTDRRELTQTVAADGLVLQQRGVGASMLTADCLPVALGAEGAVAILHAGWRGLAGGVIERGVCALHELRHEGGIAAAIGPCAGRCCYETGEEVHHAFGGAHRRGRHLDLRALARDRLLAAGVSDIQELAACTICDEDFFSYRREGERAGRQAGVAWLS